jgi:hypothetical protein
MMKYVLLTFTILSFFNSAFSELDEALHHNEGVTQVQIVKAQATIVADQDCEKKNCHHEEHEDDHCQNFCSGLHNLTSIQYSINLKKPSFASSSTQWSFFNHYLMPSLDPGLRPPISA